MAGDASHSTQPAPGTTKVAGTAPPPPAGSCTSWIQRVRRLDPARSAPFCRMLARLVFEAALGVSVPSFLVWRSAGQPMAQVWIMSLALCSYAFRFMLCIWRSWCLCTDLIRLSYGPLLAYFVAGHFGAPRAAVFIVHASTVFAAGYVGYSLSRHRLHVSGTVPALALLPNPPPYSRQDAEGHINLVHNLTIIVVVLWAAFMALLVKVVEPTDELMTAFVLSAAGWMHAALWAVGVSSGLICGVSLDQPTPSVSSLIPCLFGSPFIGLILGQVPFVLFHWLLMVDLVAYLWYYFAVYLHYLHTAPPRVELLTDAGDMGIASASPDEAIQVVDLNEGEAAEVFDAVRSEVDLVEVVDSMRQGEVVEIDDPIADGWIYC